MMCLQINARPLSNTHDGTYFVDSANELYWESGGEPPGVWHGKGAKILGLSGIVEAAPFQNLLKGLNPDGSMRLVKSPKGKNRFGKERLRTNAIELVVNPRKELSIWLNALPSAERKLALNAWEKAIERLIEFCEDLYLARSGVHGQDRQKAFLAAGSFQHHVTRARESLEPQFHKHVVVCNTCQREDGTFGAIDTRELLNWCRPLGPMISTHFAWELKKVLGVSFEQYLDERGRIRPATVPGVPKGLVETWSSRSRELKEAIALSDNRGDLWRESFSSKARAMAARSIRGPKKDVPPLKELMAEWTKTAEAHGYTSDMAVAACHTAKPVSLPRAYRSAWKESLEALTKTDTRFTRRALVKEICERIQHHGADLGKLLERIDRNLSRSGSVVVLGERDREIVYTTKAVLKQERALEREFERLLKAPGATVAASILEPLLAKHERLTPEQKAAVTHLATNGASISALVGVAGAGKSTALGVLREALEGAGYRVIGGALAGIAAEELSGKASIPSRTIASYLWKIDDGLRSRVKAIVQREFRKILIALGQGGQDESHSQFSKKTVLVIDEAGMLHTKATLKLVRHVRESGGTVILCGDPSQLQPIEAGAPFARLLKLTKCAELLTNKRQHDALDRLAASAVREGDIETAISAFVKRGRIKVLATREGAMNALVRAWTKSGGVDAPGDNLIYAETRSDVRSINDRCQKQALAKGNRPGGWIKLTPRVEIDSRSFNVGDYVRFSEPIYEYGILNGYRGKLVSIGRHQGSVTLSIRLDSKHSPAKAHGRLVTIPQKALNHRNFGLGYCSTIHSGQGSDTSKAFVLVGSRMTSQETFYTTITRGKTATKIFVDKLHAGDQLEDLHRQVARSRKKEMALDVAETRHMTPEISREIERSRKA